MGVRSGVGGGRVRTRQLLVLILALTETLCACLHSNPAAVAAGGSPYSRTVLVDGRDVHYLDTAPGQEGPALLVVPGFLGSTCAVRSLADGLAGCLRVVIVDLPGFGGSAPPARTVSMPFYLEFLAAFASQVGLERFTLAGMSMGASICTGYSVDRPEQVENLILISPFGLRDQGGRAARIRRWEPLLPLACAVVGRRQVERRVRGWTGRDEIVTPELVDSYWRPFTTPQGRRVVAQATREVVARCTIDELLPRVQARILVLVGQNDPLIDADTQARFATLMADGSLRMFADSGHFLPLEVPLAVCQEIHAFIAGGRPP